MESKARYSFKELAIRYVHFASKLSGVVAAVMILLSVLVTCQMIWVRFVLSESTIWQTEFVTYLMICATFIGLPYVQLLRGHVNVDLLPIMVKSQSVKKAITFITLGLSIVTIMIIFVYGYELFATALEEGWTSDTVWGVRLWLPYISIPVGLGLFLLQLFVDMLTSLSNKEN